tara:strand:+ start:2616 stop:3266 length:651 start_codon:yes stop_codon:yes gene_type:complete
MSGGEIEAMNLVNKLKQGVEDGAGNVINAGKELSGDGLNKITTTTGPAWAKGQELVAQVPSMDDVKNTTKQAWDGHVANTQASNAEVGVNPDGSFDTDKLANYVGDKVNPVKNLGRAINAFNVAGEKYNEQKGIFNARRDQAIQDYNNSNTPTAPTYSPSNEGGENITGGRRRKRRRRTRRKKRRKSRKSRRKRRKSRKKKRRRKSRKKSRRRRRR